MGWKLLGEMAVNNALRRNGPRTLLTILGVSVAVLSFVTLRTVLTSWNSAAEHSLPDRIATRHKVTFVMRLPLNYVPLVRGVSGIRDVTFIDWFAGKDPKHEREFFGQFAVETDTFFDVYSDFAVSKTDLEAWKSDRQGAIVGDVIAKKMGWRRGDRVVLQGTVYPGDWEFRISGVYRATRKSVDRSSFIFHWKYLNENAPGVARDYVGWIVSLVRNPERSASVSREIDRLFEQREHQTVTMSEREMNVSMMGMLTSVLKAIDAVSLVILAILSLILGNTVAMGVRERTHEYGVLRAIGFRSIHLMILVIVEGITIGIISGVLSALLAFPLIHGLLGRLLEAKAGAFFPYFRVDPLVLVSGVLLAALLGGIAASIPAYHAGRIKVTAALRTIG
jgi:putative ABC transport system permease protein